MEKWGEIKIEEGLKTLSTWERSGDRIRKEFRFRDFIEAFSFMSGAALHSEKMNHHPEWSNVYRTVTVELTTHEAGGLTEKDFQLASILDSLAS